MIATRTSFARRLGPVLVLAAWAVVGATGCGQRGALYMPDRNARVVTRPAAAPSATDSSAPVESSAPASTPR